MLQAIKDLFRNDNDRELDKLGGILKQVLSFSTVMAGLSDLELQAQTNRFRHRLQAGEQLKALLPEAFAVVREAAHRVLGMKHYDVQIMGGAALVDGQIAEMMTGEGKTLVSTLPVYLYALQGNGVHVATANEYLAMRDSEQLKGLFSFLGMTVGCTRGRISHALKKEAYACDITYGTGCEFGFDYLRDHQARATDQLVQRGLHFILIDEVDSILIDEARTPLILSGRPRHGNDFYHAIDRFVKGLSEQSDYDLRREEDSVTLTEIGVNRAEQTLFIDNLYDPQHTELLHGILQSLRACTLLERDVHYVVHRDEIVLVDHYTGRLMHGRRYTEGLHQAVEAKENTPVKQEAVIEATIALQHYFRCYAHVSGMTGTARTDNEEFKRVYGLNVVTIPTHLPSARIDLPDLVFKSQAAKYKAIVEDVACRHLNGQPVLIGTLSIVQTEELSSLLAQANIPHRVLNAKHHDVEADIVALAGQRGSVTVSTNMAGRGTDIRLGEEIARLGGLHVIGNERHESRRIDRQLRGRAGRQGDPGSSQFYLSIQDKLLRQLGDFSLTDKLEELFQEDTVLTGLVVDRTIAAAQRILEGKHFDAFMMVLQFDEVINRQRETVYEERRRILHEEQYWEMIRSMIYSVLTRAVDAYCADAQIPEEWDRIELAAAANQLFGTNGEVHAEDLEADTKPMLVQRLCGYAEQAYQIRRSKLGDQAMDAFERYIFLQTLDKSWIGHLVNMRELRQGIHLQAYAGNHPLQEYEFQGYAMYKNMIHEMEAKIVRIILNTSIHLAA